MAKIYNKTSEKEKRRRLRKNMTEAELMLWDKLKSKRMEGLRFLRQYSIESFVADFYCPALKLVIEVDGKGHSLKDAIEYDEKRTLFFETLHIKVLRFTNEEVLFNVGKVVESIRKGIALIKDKVQPPYDSASVIISPL